MSTLKKQGTEAQLLKESEERWRLTSSLTLIKSVVVDKVLLLHTLQ